MACPYSPDQHCGLSVFQRVTNQSVSHLILLSGDVFSLKLLHLTSKLLYPLMQLLQLSIIHISLSANLFHNQL